MKTTRFDISALLVLAACCVVALSAGCGGESSSEQAALPEGHPDMGAAQAAVPAGMVGTVAETFDSGGYTYVRLDVDGKEVWAASAVAEVAVGEEIFLADGMLMKDFKSASLDRVFPEIWFVNAYLPAEKAAEAAATAASGDATTVNPGTDGHPQVVIDASGIDFSGIEKPAGGMTVAEIHAAKGALDGKEILVRGKVVKFTGNVMNRNWIHLRDGSGEGAGADLAVTSAAAVKVGQTILVRGVAAEDKDFGYGYHYDILIEEADVTVE